MNITNTLLRIYPQEWRVRYEDEFSALLEQQHMSLIDIADIALGALDAHLSPQVTAIEVKSERGLLVNRSTFVKWSGAAGMVGSILFLLGLIAVSTFSNDEYPYTYDGMDVGATICYTTGIALLLLFTIGLAANYGRRVGLLGQAGLLITLAGLGTLGYAAMGHFSEITSGLEKDWWEYFIGGLAATLLGVSITCLAGLMQNALPALACRLCLAGGFSAVAIGLLSTVLAPLFESGIGQQVGIAITLVTMLLFMTGLFLLGYAMWSRQETVTARVESAMV